MNAEIPIYTLDSPPLEEIMVEQVRHEELQIDSKNAFINLQMEKLESSSSHPLAAASLSEKDQTWGKVYSRMLKMSSVVSTEILQSQIQYNMSVRRGFLKKTSMSYKFPILFLLHHKRMTHSSNPNDVSNNDEKYGENESDGAEDDEEDVNAGLRSSSANVFTFITIDKTGCFTVRDVTGNNFSERNGKRSAFKVLEMGSFDKLVYLDQYGIYAGSNSENSITVYQNLGIHILTLILVC